MVVWFVPYLFSFYYNMMIHTSHRIFFNKYLYRIVKKYSMGCIFLFYYIIWWYIHPIEYFLTNICIELLNIFSMGCIFLFYYIIWWYIHPIEYFLTYFCIELLNIFSMGCIFLSYYIIWWYIHPIEYFLTYIYIGYIILQSVSFFIIFLSQSIKCL